MQGGIGIGKGLKVSDKFFGLITLLYNASGSDHLFIYGKAVIYHGPCSGTASITKDTALVGDGSIAIWATQARIQRYLLNAFSKYTS